MNMFTSVTKLCTTLNRMRFPFLLSWVTPHFLQAVMLIMIQCSGLLGLNELLNINSFVNTRFCILSKLLQKPLNGLVHATPPLVSAQLVQVSLPWRVGQLPQPAATLYRVYSSSAHVAVISVALLDMWMTKKPSSAISERQNNPLKTWHGAWEMDLDHCLLKPQHNWSQWKCGGQQAILEEEKTLTCQITQELIWKSGATVLMEMNPHVKCLDQTEEILSKRRWRVCQGLGWCWASCQNWWNCESGQLLSDVGVPPGKRLICNLFSMMMIPSKHSWVETHNGTWSSWTGLPEPRPQWLR